MRQAVFLDRDGVINQAIVRNGKPYPPHTLAELVLTPDALPSLTQLKAAGFLLIVVTNQPDITRGDLSYETLAQIHHVLSMQLPLDEIFVCVHDDIDCCNCRKPKPGLLQQAAEKYNLDLTTCYMIGDRWRDIEAGQQACCKTIWINRGYHEKTPTHFDFSAPTLTAATT